MILRIYYGVTVRHHQTQRFQLRHLLLRQQEIRLGMVLVIGVDPVNNKASARNTDFGHGLMRERLEKKGNLVGAKSMVSSLRSMFSEYVFRIKVYIEKSR